MRFEYQAIDGDGGVVRGIIEASSINKVLQILLHKQLHPLDIRFLTDSTVELSRLNSLKQRLEGKETPPPEIEIPYSVKTEKKMKDPIEWTYIIYLVMIIGVLATAVWSG